MSVFFLKHPKETDLALFAGGESGPFARWRIERHVESCPRCRQIAADFFRLPEQLDELADLPSVDWKQMAMAIESGVRADAAMGRPARRYGFQSTLAWQAGLVAATVVVGVIIFQQIKQQQPEPELVAAAEIEAPPPQVDEQQEIVTAEAARSEGAAAAAQSKAVEGPRTLPSDIAAPAAPPPPPPAAHNEAVSRRVSNPAAQPIAAEAEAAEDRLRNDAASRVGAVSALGGAAPAAFDQAGVFRQARLAWAQLPVETVNFDDAPISLSGGYTAFAGAIVKTPSIIATNRSDRSVSGFELLWIVGDADASATALVQRQGLSMVPGAVTSSGGDRSWRLPGGIISPKIRIYLSSVSFEDGGAWTPSSEQIARRGLVESGASYPALDLLPGVVERDDKP